MVRDYKDLIYMILSILRVFDEEALKESITKMWPYSFPKHK